jgi:hypothetical protein
MLNIFMPTVLMLSVVMVAISMQGVIKLNVAMLSQSIGLYFVAIIQKSICACELRLSMPRLWLQWHFPEHQQCQTGSNVWKKVYLT